MLTLSKYIEDNEVPFFNSIDYAPFNDSNFIDMLNEWCKFNHGSLQIRPLIEDALKTDADVIRKRVTNLINVRKYNYSKLYNTTLLEYNPIENYSMTEEGTDTTTASGTKTDDLGAYSDTTSGTDTTTITDSKTEKIGAYEDSSASTTENDIARQTTNTNNVTTDTGSETHERKVAPFDSDTYAEQELNTDTFKDRRNVTETETNVSPHTDTTTTRGTTTSGARENSYTTSTTDALQHGMTRDISSRSNSYTDESRGTTTHKFTRSGNIGVTTSQQMLESERNIAMFNFIGIVAHDIVKSICICIY